MQSGTRPAEWVGRAAELEILKTAVGALRQGEGSVIWVEGEPGIGKSTLVEQALAAGDPDWDVSWGSADQLTERLPLRVMREGLRVRPGSPDQRRSAAALALREQRQGLFGDGEDASAAGIEIILALVDGLCASGPAVLVIDDLQWADSASLATWHQLAASVGQLPLLLVGICWPSPRRAEVQRLRSHTLRCGGQVITLGPLAEPETIAMVEVLVGSPPGDALRRLAAQAAGNPLYLRELVDALIREEALAVGPAGADLAGSREQLPVSLTTVVRDRLSSVTEQTAELLRMAALLQGKIAITDLAAVMRTPASELAPGVQEAVAAGILTGSGTELAFRHQLIGQALYESMPSALRTALHSEAARELATAGADVVSVAQQLSAAGRPGGDWARAWLIRAAPTLSALAPRLAAEVLRRELEARPATGKDADRATDSAADSSTVDATVAERDRLTVNFVWALLAVGSYEEAAREAGRALRTLTDPDQRGAVTWAQARALAGRAENEAAIALMRESLESGGLPAAWEARMLAWLAIMEREYTGDLDDSDATAAEALARDRGDRFATSLALTSLWLTHSVRRDHAAALSYLDEGLRVVGDDPVHAEWRVSVLGNRIFTLENLDRWPEAEQTLQEVREFAQRSGIPDRSTWVNAAVLRYWLGQWDDALAELGPDEAEDGGLSFPFLRERWPALLAHGVAALIASRRAVRAEADRQLRLGLDLPVATDVAAENLDFLIAARAVVLEQDGDTRGAMEVLADLLPRRAAAMTLVHQWMPDLVRLALAVGETGLAQSAAEACAAEAAAETRPARAATASLRCRGLLEEDPEPLREAVARYRAAGSVAELPAALEDLAAVLAARGQVDDARAALNEAVSGYEHLGARWDIQRADRRLRARGVRRATGGRRRTRPASGWDALTPTEVRVAAMIARGDSTSDIAMSLFLSRRTVQTYISRILTKLDAKGRVDIAREALRRDIT